MVKVIFIWYLVTGVVIPTEKVNDKQTFTIKQKKFIVEYCYKSEVYNWIKTKQFKYENN